KAILAYEPKPYPHPIVLLRSALGWGSRDLGWQRLAEGGFSLHLVPGNHFTIMKEPQVAQVASHLGACIRAVEDERV
ncbi:MAG: hypothetical protein ACK4L7_02435, partial [Flavobacteriales bacterium]